MIEGRFSCLSRVKRKVSDMQEGKKRCQYQEEYIAIQGHMQITNANATRQLFGGCLMSLENYPTSKVL